MKVNLKKLKTFLAIVTCAGFLCYLFFTPWSQLSKREKVTKASHLYNGHTLSEDDIALFPSCGRFPVQKDLNISDTYWQVTNTTNGTFYLFNAYLDDRAAVNGSVVRILGLINRLDPTVDTYCQIWYDGIMEPIPVDVYEYRNLWPSQWGENKDGASPFLITCENPLASQGLVPAYVSLVEDECSNANNIFSVSNKRQKGPKKTFLVCWRGANFDDDISLLVIEWAETLRIFQVDTVVVYVEKLHINVMEVLRYYEKLGFFIVKFIKYPKEFPNKRSQSFLQWLQSELISYHDAFYEHLYQYEFMIPMDVDEFAMPLHEDDRTWHDLMRRTNQNLTDNKIIDGYTVLNMFFLLKSVHENETIEGIPKKFRFISNIYHAENFTASRGGAKTFMRMDRILNVHNHMPISCVNPEDCNLLDVDTNVGRLSHYRTECTNEECVKSLQNPVKDTRFWKYKDELLENINSTLASIGMH